MAGWDTAFATPPRQWGLRGDPLLWDEMRAVLAMADAPDPATSAEVLRVTWEALTGVPLSTGGPVHINRLNRGGMSGGQVSPVFWRDTALPLLLDRVSSGDGAPRLKA